jgi:hypothetical protein
MSTGADRPPAAGVFPATWFSRKFAPVAVLPPSDKMARRTKCAAGASNHEVAMNIRRTLANICSSLLAAGAGVATLLVSVHYLAPPSGWIDWAVQLCGAATVAIFVFFLSWGHWQSP